MYLAILPKRRFMSPQGALAWIAAATILLMHRSEPAPESQAGNIPQEGVERAKIKKKRRRK
jgi:hypothetical protein